MSDHPQKPELDNEHRYAALLALTSQELPAKQPGENADTDGTNVNPLAEDKNEALFKQLDADPAALESFLKRELHRQSLSQSTLRSPLQRFTEWFAAPTIRYAAAFGAAAVFAVAMLLQVNQSTILDAIEQSYAQVRLEPAELQLPWERPPVAVGFAPTAGNDSPANVEFSQGLMRGKQKVTRAPISAASDSNYAALGEWNVLLWAAALSEQQAANFWREQRRIGGELRSATFDGRETDAIAAHLDRTNAKLEALVNGQDSARNARDLAMELLLFREQFATHDPARLTP